MKSIIFLGAGASVDAGYPLTESLLSDIEKSIKDSWFSDVREQWARFKAFRRSARGALGAILNSPNPELILTIPDILEATRKESDQRTWRDLRKAWQRNDRQQIEIIQKRWDNPTTNKLAQGRFAKWNFQQVADRFFSFKHYLDSKDGSRARREYLHHGFARLCTGDTVITTNWDTLAERTLMEVGHWYVGDGYGFSVPLKIHSHKEGVFPSSSAIKVLKLHGSMGWFRKEKALGAGELYLREANYLQHLEPPGFQGTISDRNAPPSGSGPDMNPLIIFPSYLKQLDDPVIQTVWDQAATAINTATEITFVGYSLPPADVAIRTLINPLRRRIAEGVIHVEVVNPSKIDVDRFVNFLGEGIKVVPKTAKQYWA